MLSRLLNPSPTPTPMILSHSHSNLLLCSSISLCTERNLRFPSNFPTSDRDFEVCLRSGFSSRMSLSLNSKLSNGIESVKKLGLEEEELDHFVEVGNKVADAAGEVIRKYFRKKFEIIDKEDLSPVTIADRAAEESMVSIILENFPSHAIYGEENGWRCREKTAEYVWVLDPIDGTKSFITGKPLFGTLIALLHKGKPIVGLIDQPVLRERWIGMSGKRTTLNGQEVSTRPCERLAQAYLYTTSPHLFSGDAEKAFDRVRSKVKVPLYGCDCYAYALLASGYVDLVVESGLKPYDFLSLVPVIEGAGGVITDWKGHQLYWEASADSCATIMNLAERSHELFLQSANIFLTLLQRIKGSFFQNAILQSEKCCTVCEILDAIFENAKAAFGFNVVAAGDKQLHKQALDSLQWQ